MNYLKIIAKVISSDVLIKDLITIPQRGATDLQIEAEETLLGKKINSEYKQFLGVYNGLDLEIISFFCVGESSQYFKRLSKSQNNIEDAYIAIGKDPAGFIYLQGLSGKIFSLDSESADIELLANSFSDFILDFIFGKHSNKFIDDDWKETLKSAKIF